MPDLRLSRRTVLRGLGTLIALPWLESAHAGTPAAAAKPPVRLGYIYVPNGVNSWKWFLDKEGTDFTLSPTLTALAEVRADVLFTSGLCLDPARGHGDGGGEHNRATAGFLTCAHAMRNNGGEPRAGISVDQLAAAAIGGATRIASLQLACEPPRPPGMCDAGYSGVYRNSVSWRTPTSPVPNEINPRKVFLRLFADPAQGAASVGQARAVMLRRSVLDLALADAKRVLPTLSGSDRNKVDEYLHSVRTVEQQIQAAESNPPPPAPAGIAAPSGVPVDVGEYLKLMMDMMVLAFQSDATRIVSLMFANEGSDRTMPWLGLTTSHHWTGHHEKKPDKLEIIHRVDKWYAEQFCYLVKRLRGIKEGSGTLLDHCGLMYGCAIRDGNLHDNTNLPILVAGRAGGAIAPGRSVKWPNETPLANLHVSLLRAAGMPDVKVGDSTGPLSRLAG